MKKILFLLYLLLSLILPACTTYQTYDELEVEAKATGDNTKLQKRERLAERATEYFRQKQICLDTSGSAWMCTRGSAGIRRMGSRNKQLSIDELIRRYRRERSANCFCGSTRDVDDFLGGLYQC